MPGIFIIIWFFFIFIAIAKKEKEEEERKKKSHNPLEIKDEKAQNANNARNVIINNVDGIETISITDDKSIKFRDLSEVKSFIKMDDQDKAFHGKLSYESREDEKEWFN